MIRARAVLLILSTVLVLGGCSSARFGGPVSPALAGPGPGYNVPGEPASPAPLGQIASEPLPPLGGMPPGGEPVAPGPIAGLTPPPMPSAPAPGRSAYVGGWTAREASGTCRVQLSSTPALDLYKASASGCANKDLTRVTAWDYRDGEIYLYQPGGAVAARLRGSGGGMEGVIAKSGAPLTLTR
jgi:hypothetical protein